MATKTAAPPSVGVNFGDSSFYSGGFLIPAGKYALEFTIQMFQGKDAQGNSKGDSRLGVMVKAVSLDDPKHEPYEQFYSMGSKAHLSFAPNPETGKGLVPVPGGPASGLPDSTNWAVLRKSLIDSGLPEGVFTNDISTIDGVHVVMQHIPEPAERAGFQSNTAENQESRVAKKIAVVSEILDDGKPWEGTGGMPSATAAPAAKGPSKVAPKTAPVAAKAAPAAEAVDEADILSAAVTAGSEVLEKSPKGTAWVGFRTAVFSKVKETFSADMAQAVADAFFGGDEGANSLLNQLGYSKVGAMVKPIS